MDLNTYVDVFHETIISHWKPNYDYFSFSDTHSTEGHGVARLLVKNDIEDKIVISLHQLNRRFTEGWISGKFEYAALQLYLAKLIKRDHTKPKKRDELEFQVKLMDG